MTVVSRGTRANPARGAVVVVPPLMIERWGAFSEGVET